MVCSQTRTAGVLFATDRKQENAAKSKGAAKSLGFGPQRNDPPALQLGHQDVTIAPAHQLGKLDDAVALAPARIDSKSPPTLYRTDAEIERFAGTTVRQAIRSSPPPPGKTKREVLIFIHGYNDTFNYAVRKTAQLAADLDLRLLPGSDARGGDHLQLAGAGHFPQLPGR